MSHVYVIAAKDGPVKIGMAKDVHRRFGALKTGSPVALALAYVAAVSGSARTLERDVHRLLAEKQFMGEWFAVSVEEAVIAIERAAGAAEIAIEALVVTEPATRNITFAKREARQRAGRPRTHTIMTPFRMPKELDALVHEWRAAQSGPVSYSAAIRELTERGLKILA